MEILPLPLILSLGMLARKSLGKVVPMIIKEKGAKEAFDDFASGKTFKSAWAGLTGQQGRIQDDKMQKKGYTKMKNVSKQQAFDNFADDSDLIGIVKGLMPLLGNLIALVGFADMEG